MGADIMVVIYKKRNYVIYATNKDKSYIVCNMNKDFSKGHTHIHNYNTAKYLINAALNFSVPPNSTSIYIIDSLIRISKNKEYIQKLKVLKIKKKAKPKYRKNSRGC